MKVTIEITVRTNKVGSDCQFKFSFRKEDWDEMNEMERNQFCFEALLDSGMIDWGYEVIE